MTTEPERRDPRSVLFGRIARVVSARSRARWPIALREGVVARIAAALDRLEDVELVERTVRAPARAPTVPTPTTPARAMPEGVPLADRTPRVPHPDAVAIAFCDRETDLAPMTVLREPDGSVVARPRLPGDRIVPQARAGAHDDEWMHVRSRTRYTRHDDVADLSDPLSPVPSHDYSSWADGRLWLRPVAEWEEPVDGRARFERLADWRG